MAIGAIVAGRWPRWRILLGLRADLLAFAFLALAFLLR